VEALARIEPSLTDHLGRLLQVCGHLIAALALVCPAVAFAQVSADDANKSNNPLNPSPAFNIQDYYVPELYGSSKYSNDVLLRGTLPLPPIGFLPWPQLIRATVPISTRPDPGGGYSTGLGDINLFDIFLVHTGATEVGVGPLITLPTAGKDALGTGKWQAGLAAVAVHPTPQHIIGGLMQWQASFAGDNDRDDVNTLTFQPFLIYNLPKGWYVRSTAIWTFDLENDHYYIPLGIGGGKVWKAGTTILNAFIEPQWTVAHDGGGLPQFAVFAGLNLTFSK
jgi:hypothetical protein